MRNKGHDKCQVQQRNSQETIQFNSRQMAEDLELAALLVNQEIRRRELPSEGLTHAKELLDRIQKFNREVITEVESVYSAH